MSPRLQKRARADATLELSPPVSLRAEGMRNDTAACKHLSPSPLEANCVPTLRISARDDRCGTYASAQFTGFEQGRHTWVGHDDLVHAAIAWRHLPSGRP
ncbi:hypothetical protein [Hydrogenophaga sp. PAMC20947]|uniref:hypothetical protein n=1 Tax=Hydrogenophaga sp. PAMC20947 TaxID=2565558 RepID=UPI00109DC02E|nr:hypothetical protein [Hydrogenophaga sp. PAMC20947]QCB45565.1 hypothetical protein E5678_05725 [Hydrogenophaga sp. PAMC20947]